MSKDNKYIVRRTLSQERFEVLWKKRRNGQATLKDLTEMDEIINRDEGVRQFVLEEMEGGDSLPFDNGMHNMMQGPETAERTAFEKIRSFFNRMLNMVGHKPELSHNSL